MSHIVKIECQVHDRAAILAACGRLGLGEPTYGETKLFSGTRTGWAIQLPDWRYPVVCDVESGTVHFDNFGGRWGNQTHFDKFLQAYSVEKTKIESRRQGHTVAEQPLADGSIKLTVQVGGVA